jgi:hypothetical protein
MEDSQTQEEKQNEEVFKNIYIPRSLHEMSSDDIYEMDQDPDRANLYQNLTGVVIEEGSEQSFEDS